MVEPVRVEVSTAPAAHLGMLGIADDGQEAFVAADPTDVLRPSSACTVDAGGATRRCVEDEELFDLDRVLPPVAEVVGVGESQSRLAVEIEQADLALVEGPAVDLGCPLVGARVAVAQAADSDSYR